MRIDKYLWTIRYFKTRNQATEACKKGQVKINASTVKPSKEVFIGEKISIRKNQVDYQIEVLDIPPSRVGAKLVDLYRKDTTPKEAFENMKMVRASQAYYRNKGAGRPTKKDRRAIEDFSDEHNFETE